MQQRPPSTSGSHQGGCHNSSKRGSSCACTNGKIDPGINDPRVEAHRDPTYFSRRRKKPPTTQPNASQLSFAEAKRRKENYLAELRRVELEEKTGKLIERAEVERQAFETGRRVRDYLLNIPNRVAGEVAAALGVPPAEGQEQVYHILNREIQQALEQLK